ncbi:MAG TPA: cytochrome c maturation protein CcmE [Actinomycetota bacterium]|nr:cytochrome c maturation protein CcmE [Actinomycetota bacterium]
MKKRHLVTGAALLVAALAWVGAQSMAGTLVYFKTPAEVLGGPRTDEAVRVGGFVERGTIERGGSVIRFIVSDDGVDLPVEATRGVPSLFEDGQGVVVEGMLRSDGVFRADSVLVKHGSEYEPPRGDAPASAELDY